MNSTFWLNKEKENGVPVLEIDVSDDYIDDNVIQKDMFDSIMKFVGKNKNYTKIYYFLNLII